MFPGYPKCSPAPPAGPCGIPGLIPGSRFILDPDPDPGKLFSKPGSGSKPGFAFLFTFGKFLVMFCNFQDSFDFFYPLR